MLQLNNLVLAFTMIAAAWFWWRAGFPMPPFVWIQERTARRLLRVAGWMLIVWIVVISVAAIPAGRIQIARQGRMYAGLEREPVMFWRELLLRTLVVSIIGVSFIVLSKRPNPAGAIQQHDQERESLPR